MPAEIISGHPIQSGSLLRVARAYQLKSWHTRQYNILVCEVRRQRNRGIASNQNSTGQTKVMRNCWGCLAWQTKWWEADGSASKGKLWEKFHQRVAQLFLWSIEIHPAPAAVSRSCAHNVCVSYHTQIRLFAVAIASRGEMINVLTWGWHITFGCPGKIMVIDGRICWFHCAVSPLTLPFKSAVQWRSIENPSISASRSHTVLRARVKWWTLWIAGGILLCQKWALSFRLESFVSEG